MCRRTQAVEGLGQECKVKIWLGSYISCCICFTKLNFSLIIKLDVSTYYLDHVTFHVIVLLNFGQSANRWRTFGLLINK